MDSRDPILNVVHRQIKRSIRVCIANQCWAAAVKLIYSGIDTMAYLSMPAERLTVKPPHFKNWVEKYLKFEGDEQLRGIDVYGARCGMLHSHSIESTLSRKKNCRPIGYSDDMLPPIRFDPAAEGQMIVVSIHALAHAFFDAIDRYLLHEFSNKKRAPIVEARLKNLVQELPFSEKDQSE